MKINIRRDSAKYFDENKIRELLTKEKEILETPIPDSIKYELLSDLGEKLFVKWNKWNYYDYNYDKIDGFNDVLIDQFGKSIIGIIHGRYDEDDTIGPNMIKRDFEYYDNKNGKKVIVEMDTKYKVIFPLPTKELIQTIIENPHLPSNHERYDNDSKKYVTEIPDCQSVTIKFDTFDEFLTKFKSSIQSLGNPDNLDILKKIGLEINKNEEVKEIR